MDKLKKLREKEKEFKDFKPQGWSRFAHMDVTKWGAFRDARKFLKEGGPSVGIYWIPKGAKPGKDGKKEHYTYKVTEGFFEKGWKGKGWVKIAEIN
ncbi:MAG: hypothetical protein PVI38_05155 [Desulfobacterales bacterium]|jgi:hypothetical protein